MSLSIKYLEINKHFHEAIRRKLTYKDVLGKTCYVTRQQSEQLTVDHGHIFQ